MRAIIARGLSVLSSWIAPKSVPDGTISSISSSSPIDAFKRYKEPNSRDLLKELKAVAYACCTINASVCASYPPRLYVRTTKSQPNPKCPTREIDLKRLYQLKENLNIPNSTKLEEVTSHPLLDLFLRINPFQSPFEIWELTTLFQEVIGSAYWLLDKNVLGVPETVWILPSQNVTPRRKPGSLIPADWYDFATSSGPIKLDPAEIIHFKYPNPNDPYGPGLSPIKASYENITLTSNYAAFRQAKFSNDAIPAAMVSPDEYLADDETARLEQRWHQKFSRAGAGSVMFANTKLKVDLLQHSLGDIAALHEAGATKEDTANAFGVPLSYLTKETNLANLQASDAQHKRQAIRPRNLRRDEKLNESLIPIYDPTGRLFLASDDPVPENRDYLLKEQESDLKNGVKTINEVRAIKNLPPVEWGDKPWLPLYLAPSDVVRAVNQSQIEEAARDNAKPPATEERR